MSSVLFLFLTHLGIGIAASLLLVGQAAGVKFFRFNAGLAAILLLIALAFRPEIPAPTTADRVALAALVAVSGALLVYWATIGRILARLRPVWIAIAVGGGAIALVVEDDQLDAEAQAIASEIASYDPVVVRNSKISLEALRKIDDVALAYSLEHKWGAALRWSRQQG